MNGQLSEEIEPTLPFAAGPARLRLSLSILFSFFLFFPLLLSNMNDLGYLPRGPRAYRPPPSYASRADSLDQARGRARFQQRDPDAISIDSSDSSTVCSDDSEVAGINIVESEGPAYATSRAYSDYVFRRGMQALADDMAGLSPGSGRPSRLARSPSPSDSVTTVRGRVRAGSTASDERPPSYHTDEDGRSVSSGTYVWDAYDLPMPATVSSYLDWARGRRFDEVVGPLCTQLFRCASLSIDKYSSPTLA